MTALTAALALIPLAMGGGEPAKEIQAPLAVVVLGGLITSTFLNMVVVPALLFDVEGGSRSYRSSGSSMRKPPRRAGPPRRTLICRLSHARGVK